MYGFYIRDERGHRPHVHVIAGGGRASISIGDRIEVGKISRMSKADVGKALDVIAEHAEELLTFWRKYNG